MKASGQRWVCLRCGTVRRKQFCYGYYCDQYEHRHRLESERRIRRGAVARAYKPRQTPSPGDPPKFALYETCRCNHCGILLEYHWCHACHAKGLENSVRPEAPRVVVGVQLVEAASKLPRVPQEVFLREFHQACKTERPQTLEERISLASRVRLALEKVCFACDNRADTEGDDPCYD